MSSETHLCLIENAEEFSYHNISWSVQQRVWLMSADVKLW